MAQQSRIKKYHSNICYHFSRWIFATTSGKIQKSQPRGLNFPSGYIASRTKLIEENVDPYKRAELEFPTAEIALLVIWDVFKDKSLRKF